MPFMHIRLPHQMYLWQTISCTSDSQHASSKKECSQGKGLRTYATCMHETCNSSMRFKIKYAQVQNVVEKTSSNQYYFSSLNMTSDSIQMSRIKKCHRSQMYLYGTPCQIFRDKGSSDTQINA